MQAALGLARRGLGSVWPNPSVGCVLVRDGRVVGRGRTAAGGRPHAETEALSQAGAQACGCTAYVTLEPCSHHGQTGPCAESLIAAKVARVVVALQDPDPRVAGRGLAMLQMAGIEVEVGLEAAAAADVNAGFIRRIEVGRPLLTLKIASSLDGRIATHRGESKWITGESARAYGHFMRSEADAILIGSGTALADDPMLDCRLPGLEHRSPVRIVVDGHLRLPLTSRLVASAAEKPLWILTKSGNPPDRTAVFDRCGVEVIEIATSAEGKIDLQAAMRELGRRGLTRLLIESGGHLAAALLRAQMVDRLAWFRAPMIVGGDGLASVMPFGIDQLIDAPRWTRLSVSGFGADLVEILQRT